MYKRIIVQSYQWIAITAQIPALRVIMNSVNLDVCVSASECINNFFFLPFSSSSSFAKISKELLFDVD